MVRQLPIIFGQKDFNQTLGTKIGTTIASDGCYVTALAMLCRYYGKATDPVHLNEAFTNGKLYVNEDMMVDDNVTKVYPDIVYQGSLLYPDNPPTPADLGKLRELMADPTISVILEISIPGGYTHFVLCAGINGVVTIANPWTKQLEDFATNYGDPATHIIKYVIYKGNPATAEVTNDKDRIDRDLNWNMAGAMAAKVGLSLTEDRERNIQLFTDKIDLLNHTITETATMAAEYKKKYDEEHTKNIDLYASHATVSKTAEDLDSKNYDLEKKADASESVVKDIVSEAGIPYDPKNLDDMKRKVLEVYWDLKEKADKFLSAPPPQSNTTGLNITLPAADPPTDPRTKSLGQNFVVKRSSILSVLFGWAFEGGVV